MRGRRAHRGCVGGAAQGAPMAHGEGDGGHALTADCPAFLRRVLPSSGQVPPSLGSMPPSPGSFCSSSRLPKGFWAQAIRVTWSEEA